MRTVEKRTRAQRGKRTAEARRETLRRKAARQAKLRGTW